MSELVSIIIPTYNRADLVLRAINSVLAQTYQSIEIIVVDDGSTDDTWQKLKDYGDLIKAVRQPNTGRSAARNLGIEMAKGGYIAFLDSDDFWDTRKIAAEVGMLHSNPAANVCYSWWALVDINEKIIRVFKPTAVGDVFEKLFWNNFISPSHILMRRKCFFGSNEHRPRFDVDLSGSEDWKLWLELAVENAFCVVQKTMAYLTKHDSNTFALLSPEKYINIMKSLEISLCRESGCADRIAALGRKAKAVWPERRGYFFYRHGLKKQALKEYWGAIRLFPGYLPIYVHLAQLLAGPKIVDRLVCRLQHLRHDDTSVIVPHFKRTTADYC